MGGDDSPAHAILDVEEWDLDTGPGAGAPPPDDLFAALADTTRRRVAWYLLDESPASVGELADVVSGWQLEGQTTVDPDDHDQIVASLHHSHLPILDEAGLADYDRDDATVEAASLAPVVEDAIRFAYAYDDALADQR